MSYSSERVEGPYETLTFIPGIKDKYLLTISVAIAVIAIVSKIVSLWRNSGSLLQGLKKGWVDGVTSIANHPYKWMIAIVITAVALIAIAKRRRYVIDVNWARNYLNERDAERLALEKKNKREEAEFLKIVAQVVKEHKAEPLNADQQ